MDTTQHIFDANRFLDTPTGWFALTRESYDLGPFPTQAQAVTALAGHIRVHRGMNDRPAGTPGCLPHVHDSNNCSKHNCGRCAEVVGLFPMLSLVS